MFLYSIFTFICSFSTMAYSMIVSSIISDFTGEEIYSQCFTIGPYLFGLGIGSYFFDKKSEEVSLKNLWNLEFLSSVTLPLSPIIFSIYLFLYIVLSPASLNINDEITSILIFGAGSSLSFFAGIMGGGQLPLIMKISKDRIKTEVILALNYLGPLLAGPFIVYLSSKATDYSVQCGIICIIQFIGNFLLNFKFDKGRKKRMFFLLIPLTIIFFSAKYYPKVENLTAKATYLMPKINLRDIGKIDGTINFIENFGILERQKTSYQIIDIFTYQSDKKYYSDDTTVFYLNGKIQFNNFSSDVYHESMLFGTLNLYKKKAQDILILGGGDGILMSMIQKEIPDAFVTLVELDEKIIEWSKNNIFLRTLNKEVFYQKSNKNKIIIDDAITFLRKNQNKKKFDLIFIDFPFPNGHELSKLYSEEFYSLVKNISNKETLVTVDLPLEMKNKDEFKEESISILKTIYKAGFKKQYGYGPHSSFVTISLGDKDLKFNYKKLPKSISLASKINLFSFIDQKTIEKLNSKERANSMFWPKRK